MAETRMFFGRPGALTALRSPQGTVGATRQRRVSVFELGVGGAAIDQMVGGSRTYVIEYQQLTREDWAILEAFAQGHEGPGPFAFLDPGQRNRLPANVSGATSVTNDTSGFTAPVVEISDVFSRTVVAGWGSATSGQAWTVVGTAADYAVNSNQGHVTTTTAGTLYIAVLDTGSTNHQVRSEITVPVVPATAAFTPRVFGRYADVSNYYEAQVSIAQTTGLATLTIRKRVAGVGAQVGATSVSVGTHLAGDTWVIILDVQGTTLRAKAWNTDNAEPADWQITETGQTDLTTGTMAGTAVRRETGNTNGVQVVDFDNFEAVGDALAPMTSSTAFTDAGPRVLALTYSSADAALSAGVTIDWPSSVFPYGVPVVAGQAICFSCYVRGGGTDAIVTYTPRIIWKDITGATLSTTSGTPVASSSGAWAQMFATGTPPANAVYADLDARHTSGASTGSISYFRRFMLNEGSTPDTTWMPGTGVWPVRFGEMPDAWPYLSPELRERPSVALIEDVT